MTTTVRARPAWRIRLSPRARALVRAGAGAGILIALLLTVGAEPFVHGLASVSVGSAAIALALGVVTTSAAAWRWRILARRLGLTLGWGISVSAYYRSQFLNSVLPGGVIGDVHRAVVHGRDVSSVPQASRAVVAERVAGQAVQIVLTVMVVGAIGMSGYGTAVSGVLLLVAIAGTGVVVAAAVSRRARQAIGRELRMLRSAFGTVGTLLGVIVTSSIVVAGHVATFIVACVAVGVAASPERLIGVALIVLAAGAIPLNIGGWGPREGAAAWAFAGAGLGATAGIAASTAFGVLALIAVAPGAAVVGGAVAASALQRRHARHDARQAVSSA